MMRLAGHLSIVLVAAAALGASPVAAQDAFRQAQVSSRQPRPNGMLPFGGLNEHTWVSQMWSVNTLYAVTRGTYPSQTTFWVIHRRSGRLENANPAVWADSRTCPAVEAALKDMELLAAVRPDAPRLGVETPVSMVTDGTPHTFWNRNARSGDAAVSLEIQGNVNSPVAQWWDKASTALADCWTETDPVG